ncbi:MAG: sulfatase family protein [Planctomycetota bacterium]|jgi:arylsulfatase A-like enzyme
MDTKLNRRQLLKKTCLGVTALTVPGCTSKTQLLASKAASERPNIIFIMADDHASHALGCYGSRINKTPNLDRIADEGMRFDNCFCTNSICAPSRAVILTGKYSHINGKIDNRRENPFDGSQQTFPKLLQKAGYETAMIGKWHLRTEPTGFDYWNVLPGQGKYHNPAFIEMGKKKKYTGYVTDLITDFCLDWLKQRKGDKPFLLMYHHKAPHRNWQPDQKHAKMYEDVDIPVPDTFDDDYKTRSDAAREQKMTIARHFRVPSDTKVEPPEGLTGEALKHWKYQRYMQDYLRCVASIDDNVGRLLDYLDESGLARFMYEESLRMPLLIRYPKEIRRGTANSDIVLNLDFAPTFLDLAGVTVPADMQGRSFRSLLEGRRPRDWRTSMYYHYYEYPGAHAVKRHYGIRTKRYKLIHFYYDIDAWELYDLQKDPNELNNLYSNPAHDAILKRLRTELGRLRRQYGDSDELSQELLQEYLARRG